MISGSSGTQWSQNRESDDSEDDEIPSTEEDWAIQDEGWTLVERSHGRPRGINDRSWSSSDKSGEKLDNTSYDVLDDFVDTEMLPRYRKEVVQGTDRVAGITSDTKTVIVHVEPFATEQHEELSAIPNVDTDGREGGLVNVVVAPCEGTSEYSEITMQPVELLLESRAVVTIEMAKESMTGLWPDGGDERTRMSVMETSVMGEDVIEPVPGRLSTEVVAEYEPVVIPCGEYTSEEWIKNETINLSVSTDLMDLPITKMTRGFRKLADEARLADVKLTPSGYMNDKVQRIAEREIPMSTDISWKKEEVMTRSGDAICEVAGAVPMAKFEIGRSMQWPELKSTGMMICELTLETEMFSPGPVWREAEPVFVAAESEVFTPVFTGGGFVEETDPLVVAEAVTSRVSAQPAVGSDFQTGLCTAVGRRDRCSLSSGDYSDKVDHVAGRSEARTVPVEHWSFFCTVDNVMPSWIRPMVIQTSKFFLSDEREAVEMPLCGENDRPVRTRKLYIHSVDTGAQVMKETHGVGPTGDRWDGLSLTDTWYV